VESYEAASGEEDLSSDADTTHRLDFSSEVDTVPKADPEASAIAGVADDSDNLTVSNEHSEQWGAIMRHVTLTASLGGKASEVRMEEPVRQEWAAVADER